MELFIPSVLLLLLAAAAVFFVLPRFGAPTLAIISVALLVYGIYQHMNAFGSEYRLSTWQLSLASYAPYIMVGGLLVVIAFYLLSISPLGVGSTAPNMPEMPTVKEMPNANSATNILTASVNNALKAAANTAAAVGIGNAANAANKGNANKGILAAPAAAVANTVSVAKDAVANATTGVVNAVKNAATAVTGAVAKPNNKGIVANVGAALGLGNAVKPTNNKGTKVPGINFPISQV